MIIPLIFEEGKNGEQAYDIFSWLLKDRIIYLNQPVDDLVAASITGQLLFCQKRGIEEVMMIINSPGGNVSDMFAIIDMMDAVKTKVRTVIMGHACSAAAMIALGGERGKRYMMRNATMMLHDISSGAFGDTEDMKIAIRETDRLRERGIDHIHRNLHGQYTRERIIDTFMGRDTYLSGEDAKNLGLVDHVIDKIDLDFNV